MNLFIVEAIADQIDQRSPGTRVPSSFVPMTGFAQEIPMTSLSVDSRLSNISLLTGHWAGENPGSTGGKFDGTTGDGGSGVVWRFGLLFDGGRVGGSGGSLGGSLCGRGVP